MSRVERGAEIAVLEAELKADLGPATWQRVARLAWLVEEDATAAVVD
jgi:hypothetical protein